MQMIDREIDAQCNIPHTSILQVHINIKFKGKTTKLLPGACPQPNLCSFTLSILFSSVQEVI